MENGVDRRHVTKISLFEALAQKQNSTAPLEEPTLLRGLMFERENDMSRQPFQFKKSK